MVLDTFPVKFDVLLFSSHLENSKYHNRLLSMCDKVEIRDVADKLC